LSDKCVVRNAAYQKKAFSIRERHNERMNESYYNSDIQADRKHLNVHFKHPEGSYSGMFEKMLADKIISIRGQQADAKVFDEFVFDVNTEYFDRHGGYEYAKSFYEEAYRMAVNEVGGEEYILSAVMHADERNVGVSDKLGRDVYHYHLHVTYIPVVDKEVKWTKRCKDPELIGKVKEVIKQVSHSKKWPRIMKEKGWVNSYSLLQDRFHDHMKEAGFTGFERGERGSTAEHLETLDYKIKQDEARIVDLEAVAEERQEAVIILDTAIADKQETVAKLGKNAETKKKQLKELKEKTAVAKKVVAEIEEIEKLGHKRTLLGGVTLSDDFWTKVLNLSKEALNSRETISGLRKKVKESTPKIAGLEKQLKAKEVENPGINDVIRYHQANIKAPQRMAETIADIMRSPSEKQEHERIICERKSSTNLDR